MLLQSEILCLTVDDDEIVEQASRIIGICNGPLSVSRKVGLQPPSSSPNHLFGMLVNVLLQAIQAIA